MEQETGIRAARLPSSSGYGENPLRIDMVGDYDEAWSRPRDPHRRYRDEQAPTVLSPCARSHRLPGRALRRAPERQRRPESGVGETGRRGMETPRRPA